MTVLDLSLKVGGFAVTCNDGSEFDFLLGDWLVDHRRLATRLRGRSDWQDFPGTMRARPLLGGVANVDDNLLHLPGGDYRAVSLRSFDCESGAWAIWWLDGRNPHLLDVPVKGRFANGCGLFFADDTFEGQPVKVRFAWSVMDTPFPRWEQAFSADGGSSWETNWTMIFRRRP